MRKIQSWWRTASGGKFATWERWVGVGVIAPVLAAVVAMAIVANALFWAPLSVSSPETLLVLSTGDEPDAATTVSYVVWRELEARGVLTEAFAWAVERIPGRAGAGPVDVLWVSGRAFQALGVAASAGRPLAFEDAMGGCREPVAVVSAEFARALGRGVDVGGHVAVGGVEFDVVGVTREGFRGIEVGRAYQVALPLECESLLGRPEGRFTLSTWSWLRVGGRTNPGIPAEIVASRLATAQAEIRRDLAPRAASAAEQERFLGDKWRLVHAPMGVSRLRRQYGRAIGGVALVALALLLVASANVGMLAAERVRRRAGEAAVRLWLGAPRRELVRAELLQVGATVGIAWFLSLPLGALAARLVVSEMSTWALTPSLSIVVGLRPAGIALGAAAASALAIAAWPIWRVVALQSNSLGISKGAQRTVAASRSYSWFSSLQSGLAYVVLSTAAVLVGAYIELDRKDLGFDPAGVLVSDVDLSLVPPNQRRSLWPSVLESAKSATGTKRAAISTATPFGTGVRLVTEVSSSETTSEVSVLTVYVAGSWFEAIDLPVESGRALSPHDSSGAPAVVILSHAAAARLFGGETAIGRTVLARRRDGGREQLQVVGISGDMMFTSLRSEPDLVAFRPLEQSGSDPRLEAATTIQLVTTSASSARAQLLAGALARVHPAVSVSSVAMEDHVRAFSVRERVVAELATWFGLAAIAHLLVGLWAAQAALASLNRRAAAIRLALGASARSMAMRTTGRAVAESGAGVLTGAVATALIQDRVKAMLTISAADDVYWRLGASIAILGVCAIASSLPAWAVARTDLAHELRQE